MRFTIEVDNDWLDTLDTLVEQVADQEDSSPEAALEKAIFAQIEEQLTKQIYLKRKDKIYETITS